jgi:hypothetical protein
MRKKHGIAPKIPRCSGPDSHNEQTPALKVPLQTELRFHSRGYERPQGRRCCDKALAHVPTRGARTSYQSQRARGPERRWRRRSRRRRGLLQLPPAHQKIPTQVLPDGRAPTSARRRHARARPGQPKNTNTALAACDILGGHPVRVVQQPPVWRADSRTPPSGGRWHRNLHQSQLSQRTRHAGADDACCRPAPRCRSSPPPQGR